jgi:hypothetical protein
MSISGMGRRALLKRTRKALYRQGAHPGPCALEHAGTEVTAAHLLPPWHQGMCGGGRHAKTAH